jgi:carboxymethylenebutenolidase
MRLRPITFADIPTSTGPMRVHLFQPQVEGLRPAVILYSEIYQMTGPIARTAAMIAGHGYIVAVPEVYHEHAAPGEAFAYDKAGTDRGNELKITKPIAAFDADARAVINFLKASPECSGKLAAVGICLGGHLAFRAAMNPEILSTLCFYATDIHQGSLGHGKCDNSLARIPEIRGELTMIWGRQDPHIPLEGRRKIYDALTNAGTVFSWHEFNGEHAFMRDEGHRYDPAHAHLLYSLVFATLGRM